MAKSWYRIALEKHFTPAEIMLLDYDQKRELMNYDMYVFRNEMKQHEFRGRKSETLDFQKMFFIIEDLPITRRQKEILKCRVQDYTIPETADMVGCCVMTVRRDLEVLRNTIDRSDICDNTPQSWKRKFTGNFDGDRTYIG